MKKAAEMIKACLEERGISQRQLSFRMGEDVRSLNQQLNRQSDMKVERFVEVLEHLGYRIEIIENDGIQKVSDKFAKQILEERKPLGLFWQFDGNVYTGIDNTHGDAFCEDFCSKEECFKWLRG